MSPATTGQGQKFRVNKMQDHVTAGLIRNTLVLGLDYQKSTKIKRVTHNFPTDCTLNQENPQWLPGGHFSTPVSPPSREGKNLDPFHWEQVRQAGDGSQQTCPSLHALKIHVSTGFYWNSLPFWKGMREVWAEAGGVVQQKLLHRETRPGGWAGRPGRLPSSSREVPNSSRCLGCRL